MSDVTSVRFLGCAAAAAFALLASPAFALTVPGTASIYAVDGSTVGASNTNDATPAPFFSVAGGSTVSLSASGLLNCCGGDPTFNGGPDGISIPPFTATVGLEVNGLSSLTGNSFLPLLGVFGDDSDPRGNVSPAGLAFDASSPTSADPLLWQIFYIGDGRQGFENPLGALLSFTAPAGATRLYVGLIDHGPGGALTPCCYGDNLGSFDLSLASPPSPSIPEPASVVLVGMGLAALRLLRRGRAA